VLTAGTSDGPVAAEVAATLAASGVGCRRVDDVGVAGVHRVLAVAPDLDTADAVVVVAGMDGALPSVVAGLTDRLVVAVPTSVGYGAAFEGIAALLTMLTACAPGVLVVNIDNGFGAGVAAARIARSARGMAAQR
jgi:pyridinium-3,5-biscarboxylic acid mononucleotide synthase